MHSSYHLGDVQEITLNSTGPDTYAFLDSFIDMAGYQIFLNVREIDANCVKSPIRFNRLGPLACEWRASDSGEPYYRLIFTEKWGETVGFRGVGSKLAPVVYTWHQLLYCWHQLGTGPAQQRLTTRHCCSIPHSLTLMLLELYEINTATHNTVENT